MKAVARVSQRCGYLCTTSWRTPPTVPRHLRGWSSTHNMSAMMYSSAPQPRAMVDPHADKRRDPPRRELTIGDVKVRYSRSGGPGGQNANKLNTKVAMWFNVIDADFLPDWVKESLLEQYSGRINNEGALSVTSERSRSQARNRDDALAKLRSIIQQASSLPPPPSAEVQRKVRSRIRKGNERRMQAKKMTAKKKAARKDWR